LVLQRIVRIVNSNECKFLCKWFCDHIKRSINPLHLLKWSIKFNKGKTNPRSICLTKQSILYLLILSGTSTEVVAILFSEDRDLISLASSLQDAKQKVMRIHIQWRINYHKKRTLIMNLGWGKKTKQVCMLPLGSSSSWQEKQQAKFYHCRNNKLDLIIIL
jgi:hypothetical protein